MAQSTWFRGKVPVPWLAPSFARGSGTGTATSHTSVPSTWSSLPLGFVTATYTVSSHLPPAIRLEGLTVRHPDLARHVSCLITQY
ncbi:hypothetical protein BDV09DRAFT_126406 [Aspergillus tetrazonus]